jgi:hypothetical protein
MLLKPKQFVVALDIINVSLTTGPDTRFGRKVGWIILVKKQISYITGNFVRTHISPKAVSYIVIKWAF